MNGRAGVWSRAFLDHPRSLGVGYLTHAKGALRIASALIKAGAACAVHAVVPATFTQTASTTIRGLHRDMESRHGGGQQIWPDYEI